MGRQMQRIRVFLLVQGATFVVAALVHRGVILAGYEHEQAATAESVIGAVLLVGWALTWVWLARTRVVGLVAHGFALLGTLP
jgi:hypothetical protein